MTNPRRVHNFYKKPRYFRSVFFAKMAEKPNIFIIYKTIALIMVWAGIWGLIEEYVFPSSPTLRYVSVLLGGLFLLYIDDGSLDELTDFNPNRYKKPEAKENTVKEEID